MSVSEVDATFCRALPKIELHAHLSGSITRPILQEIWDTRVAQEPTFAQLVPDPRIALADANTGQSISSFFAHFNTYIYHLISSIDALRYATRAVLEEFANDGVAYLELRTTPRSIDTASEEDAVRVILDVIDQWNAFAVVPSASNTASLASSTTRLPTADRMIARLILSIDQAKHDASQAMQIVDLALRLRGEGRPVVGVDLCGDPNKSVDRRIFREAFLKARQRGLGVTIHFAEVPASSTAEDLAEELSWNPKRLGHVIHVPPAVREEIKKRGIHVELCLTCNVLAGMLPLREDRPGRWEDHHFRDWWDEGRDPMLSLGTDDIGVFGSPSSEEHRLVGEHFGLSQKDLIHLSRNAIEGAFCEEEVRRKIRDRLAVFEREHFHDLA